MDRDDLNSLPVKSRIKYTPEEKQILTELFGMEEDAELKKESSGGKLFNWKNILLIIIILLFLGGAGFYFYKRRIKLNI